MLFKEFKYFDFVYVVQLINTVLVLCLLNIKMITSSFLSLTLFLNVINRIISMLDNQLVSVLLTHLNNGRDKQF